MLFSIQIDFSQLVSPFRDMQAQIEDVCDTAAKGAAIAIANRLEEEIKRSDLHSQKNAMLGAIQLLPAPKGVGTVGLDTSDPIVKSLEEGAPPYDMKPGMLDSPKAKVAKNGGKYLIVPFSWGTPNANPANFSGILPSAIYKILKKVDTPIPTNNGGVRSEGLRVNQLPTQFQIPQTRAPKIDALGAKLYDAYTHKAPIHQGIVRTKKSDTAQKASYYSFRVVSDKSDPNAWIHPGFQPHNFLQSALANIDIDREVQLIIDKELAKI